MKTDYKDLEKLEKKATIAKKPEETNEEPKDETKTE